MADLPSKEELVKKHNKAPLLSLDSSFDDLRECSTGFKKAFMDAWKAIKNGSLRKLEDSVKVMKAHAGSTCPGLENYLNVCYLQSVVTTHIGEPNLYYMTLLAHAAANKQKGMVKYLQDKGAKAYVSNGICGSPLTQVLVHALLFNCPNAVDIEIIQLLCNIPYNMNVVYRKTYCSPIQLAIELKRLDIVKLLVESGAHPIDPSIPSGIKPTGITQLLEEYYEFGTNNYITWLLHEHLLSHELPEFIETVVQLEIFNKATMSTFAKVGRHPAHAILTSGHEEMIRKFIERHGSDLLTVKDEKGTSALQISAEKGDMESVRILVNMGNEFKRVDKDDMTTALLAASKGNHSDIVKCILLMDVSYIPKSNEKLEDLTCVFEALRDINPTIMMKRFPIAHYAAKRGIIKLFKVVFPLTSLGEDMFTALTGFDRDNKTPLELAIENDHISILRVLQERISERESQSGANESKEKKAWEELWTRMGPIWLLHACSHGSVEAVKFFIEMGCSPNYESIPEGKTPLSCACGAGKDQTVGYLLSLEQTKIPKHSAHSPLILAAENGFARCVELLLNKGANINEYCPKSKYNALMLAIERKHSATALTILSDKKQGLASLQYRCGNYKTPMRMLIQHMPKLAEWVLNTIQLDTSEALTSPCDNDDEDSRCYHMEDKFELIEDFLSPRRAKTADDDDMEMVQITLQEVKDDNEPQSTDWQPQFYKASEHPVQLMVDYDRENLLNHPLVQELIDYKWKRIAIPGFLIYLFFYMAYLILLTAYALTLPRPDSNFTQTNSSISNSTAGLSTSRVNFLLFATSMCLLFSVIYLILEVIQLVRRRLKYLQEKENYIQVVLCVLTVIFVFPYDFSMEDWLFPSYKWQIGAIAIFFGWLNCIILLKNMPYFGVNITMLFSVYYNFLSIIYLPILLVLTFGFPFYMLLVFDGSHFENTDQEAPAVLLLFGNPFTSLWNVIVQTAGDINTSEIFNADFLFYPVLSSLLYIVFVFAMPILFNNFLIGVAVGETGDEREIANLTIINEKVNSIFEMEESIPLLRRLFFKRRGNRRGKRDLDEETLREYEANNKAILQEIEEKSHNEDVKQSVSSLTKQVVALKDDFTQTRTDLCTVQDKLISELSALKDDLKEDLAETKVELKVKASKVSRI